MKYTIGETDKIQYDAEMAELFQQVFKQNIGIAVFDDEDIVKKLLQIILKISIIGYWDINIKNTLLMEIKTLQLEKFLLELYVLLRARLLLVPHKEEMYMNFELSITNPTPVSPFNKLTEKDYPQVYVVVLTLIKLFVDFSLIKNK